MVRSRRHSNSVNVLVCSYFFFFFFFFLGKDRHITEQHTSVCSDWILASTTVDWSFSSKSGKANSANFGDDEKTLRNPSTRSSLLIPCGSFGGCNQRHDDWKSQTLPEKRMNPYWPSGLFSIVCKNPHRWKVNGKVTGYHFKVLLSAHPWANKCKFKYSEDKLLSALVNGLNIPENSIIPTGKFWAMQLAHRKAIMRFLGSFSASIACIYP